MLRNLQRISAPLEGSLRPLASGSLHLVTIVFCFLLGLEVFRHWRTPNGQHDQLAIGTEVRWLTETVLVALRAGCPFCQQSAPFYSRLMAQLGNRNGCPRDCCDESEQSR